MALPIVPLLGGLLRGVLSGLGGGLRGVAAGAMGRAAMGGGVTGAASRIGLAGMVAASGKAIPAPAVGALGRDFVTLGKSLVGLPGKIREFGDSLLEGQRHLAQYNGELAAAFGQLEAERTNRDIRQANVLSPSAARLARNQSALEEQLLPVKTKWNEMMNRLQSSFSGVGAEAMKRFNNSALAELVGIRKAVEDLKAKTPEPPLNQLSLDIGAGKFANRQHPPRHPLT